MVESLHVRVRGAAVATAWRSTTSHTKVSQGVLTLLQAMMFCGERGIRDF